MHVKVLQVGRYVSNYYRDDSEWWHGKDIESNGTDMIQGTNSSVLSRAHGKARRLLYLFIGILEGTFYFRLVRNTKDMFQQCEIQKLSACSKRNGDNM